MGVSTEYNDDSISALKGAERIRKRPAVFLGSNGVSGCRHTVIEMVGNASDEQTAGYGTKLEIAKYEDGAVSVRDFGRGVPLGWNEKENNWNYYLIYEELYAGGKYDSFQEILRDFEERNAWSEFRLEDFPYIITVGLNGLGAAATQCTSDYFTVISYRDGKATRMDYKDGAHILDELIVEDTTEPNGTFVKWKPSDKVFSDTSLSSSWLTSLCNSLSYVSGFDVTFNNKGKITEFPHRTAYDVMVEKSKNAVAGSYFTHVYDKVGDICICQCDTVMGGHEGSSEFFNNKVKVSGGAHAIGVEIALSDFFKGIAKENGLKILPRDYSGKLSFIIQTLCNKVSNRGQTKDSVEDSHVINCVYQCITQILKKEMNKGTDWLMEEIEEVIQTAKNRITVEEMAKNVKEITRSIKKTVASSKFIPCKYYGKGDPSNIEYWIVEGDSAGDKFAHARDYLYQCVQKIRGKSLNLWKASLDQLLKNREVRDIIAALGCGVELGIDEFESFDISNLRVGKIILGADADIDGKHIIILLFLLIYRLFPQLLYTGRVYIAIPPLYVITKNDNTDVYCFDQDELEVKKAEIGAHNIRGVVRFKGLGEMEEEQLWDTIANPATRRLQQIKISPDDTEVYEVLEVLFGKSTDARKRAVLGSMIDGDLDDINENMESIANYLSSMELNQVEVEEVVA